MLDGWMDVLNKSLRILKKFMQIQMDICGSLMDAYRSWIGCMQILDEYAQVL